MGSLARYSGVFKSLERLRVPRGTKLVYAEGVEVARNCNTLVDEMTGEWLFIMGDDHRFDADILLRLLDRRLDIVVPLVLRRQPPFETVLYKRTPTEKYLLSELPTSGLIEVDSAGSAGMLIRHWVFGSLPRPWFKWRPTTSEDIGFCLDARAEGFKVHADLDQTMTHYTTCEIQPVRVDGKWVAKVHVEGQADRPRLKAVA